MPLSTVDTGLFGQTELSSTSNTIALGVKTFTLDVDHNYIEVDYTVQIVSNTDPDCWMYGVVTAKSTPTITVSIFKISGTTGTFTDWSLQTIAGPFAGLPASQTTGFSTNSAAVPSVGTSLSWTVETGKAFYDNSTLYVASVSDRTAFFFATVVSYNSGTGAIKLVVNRASGSGTFALWSLSLVDVTASFKTSRGDADYSIKSSDNVIFLTTSLTADRTWTLPLADSVPAGKTITIIDPFGVLGGTPLYSIVLASSGSDFLLGSTGTISDPGAVVTFYSDGVSTWSSDPKQSGVFRTLTVNDGGAYVNGLTETYQLLVDDTATFDGPVTANDDLDVVGVVSSYNDSGSVTTPSAKLGRSSSQNVSVYGSSGGNFIVSASSTTNAKVLIINATTDSSDSAPSVNVNGISFRIRGVEYLAIGDTGDTTVTGLLTTNGQVKFPATQNPSSNANTLDDYEEGTWTPALGAIQNGDFTAATGISVDYAQYTKIGELVTLHFGISVTGLSSTALTQKSVLAITGLPFTPRNISGNANIEFGSVSGLMYKSLGARTTTLLGGGIGSAGLYIVVLYVGAPEADQNSPMFIRASYVV